MILVWLGVHHPCSRRPGGECDGSAFGSVCLSVCFVCVHSSKTIAPSVLICLRKKYYTRGSVVLQDDPDRNPDSQNY